jgi:hypothetical protein
MKFPKYIKIGNCHYAVKVHKILKDEKDRILYGRITYGSKTIRLNKTFPKRMKESLLHEIVHGVDDFMDTGLTEKQVNQMAQGLHSVLIDNPHILRYVK